MTTTDKFRVLVVDDDNDLALNLQDILQEEGLSKKLDIKKLKSLNNSFRVRVGTYRILFELSSENVIEVYAILPRKTAYNQA